MSDEDLRAALERVHAELGATDRVDDNARGLLLQVMADLARVLDRSAPPPEPEEPPGLGERIEEAAKHFEAEHPRLFTTLQQIADTLRGGGI